MVKKEQRSKKLKGQQGARGEYVKGARCLEPPNISTELKQTDERTYIYTDTIKCIAPLQRCR